MTNPDDIRARLEAKGIERDQITRMDAQIDQARAWLNDTMPHAVASTVAYREGRIDEAIEHGRQIEIAIDGLGLDLEHPATPVLEAVMAQAAALYLDGRVFRGRG